MSAISSLRFRPRSTPVNSPAGQKRLFLAEDGLLKTIDDEGNVQAVADGTGLPDAPSDTKQYARKDGAWVEVVGTRVYKTSAFTAAAFGRYHTSGTPITVTDPTSPAPVAGDVYEVTVVGGIATIGGVNYAASRFPIEREYNGSSWVTLSPVLSDALQLSGGYTEGVVAIGTVTSSQPLAITAGTVLTATLTASTACTFTMPTATAGKSFTLLLKQAAATGLGTAVFTGVKWETATAPTVTATAGKMDIFSFVSDGTNWYGSVTQGYTP